jgi:hypothetical protein
MFALLPCGPHAPATSIRNGLPYVRARVEGNSLRFFPDGRRFVTTSLSGLVKLQGLGSEHELHSFINGVGACSDSALSPDGKRLERK